MIRAKGKGQDISTSYCTQCIIAKNDRKYLYLNDGIPNGELEYHLSIMESPMFYRYFIDPLLRRVHAYAAGKMVPGGSVIDVACGNGTLAIMHAERASNVLGIDLSDDAIAYARDRAERLGLDHVDFIVFDALKISELQKSVFRYATISMAVHQFSVDESISILTALKSKAEEIIIIDYTCPLSIGFAGILVRVIEKMAGKEHHRHFRKFMEFGGLSRICETSGLRIINKFLYNSVFEVLICTKIS